MQNIQTVALVTQTEETRVNTRALELLQDSASNIGVLGALGIFLATLQPLDSLNSNVTQKCLDAGKTRDYVLCKLHENWFTLDKHDMFFNYAITSFALCTCLALYLTRKRRNFPNYFKRIWIFLALSGAIAVTLNYTVSDGSSSNLTGLARWTF